MQGFNVTLPHKEKVIPLLDEVSPEARTAGAVNTVVFADGKTRGYNTDIYGFAQNLKAGVGDLDLYKPHALVLGAGGAARAAIAALQTEGWGAITVANRTQERAQELRKCFGRDIEIFPWELRHVALRDATFLVNTTSLGMKGQGKLDLRLDELPREALVTDIVYNPLETPLLAQARARGNPTVDGLGMLLYQAQPGFEMWFGRKPEVTLSLRRHVMQALAGGA